MPSNAGAQEPTIDYERFDIMLLLAQLGISAASADLARMEAILAQRGYMISLWQLGVDALSTLSAIGAYQSSKGDPSNNVVKDFLQSPTPTIRAQTTGSR